MEKEEDKRWREVRRIRCEGERRIRGGERGG